MNNGAMNEEIAQVQTLMQQAMSWLTDKGLEFAMDLVTSVVILLAGWLVISLVKRAAERALRHDACRSQLLVKFTLSVITKVCWAFLLVTVLARLGVNVGPLIAGLGVTGFILGFAFQESLSNLAAGLMIAINNPFQVGDRVKVAGFEGQVLEVNMMATVLATEDAQRIVVPNKSAWGSPIVNFTVLAKNPR